MARILVLQHGATQGAGRLGATLRDHGFKLDHRLLAGDEPGPLPPDLDGFAGLITLGGTQNVGDGHPWIPHELELIREAHDRFLPCIGICLGHQMIAQALGGEVGPMLDGAGRPAPEAGFAPVELVGPGQTDRVLSGVRWKTMQFQTHAQAVTKLPPGATLLATSPACEVQAFTAGTRTYAFQYHLECDRPAIDRFYNEQTGLFEAAGVNPELLHRQCDEHYATFARLADRVCVNIATLCFAFGELTKA